MISRPLFIFSIILNLLLLLAIYTYPSMLCASWDGEYYSNGKCYITENLDMCTTETGAIRDKTIKDYYYNINRTKGDLK